MIRLVGGDYQLDLSPIEIEESVDGETYTSITDKSVLDQLTVLKAFIGKSGMIKPVWVKLLNGETDEIIVTRGSLSTSDGTTFLIKVLLAGFILTLSVEFTQMTDADSNPLDDWYIDTNDAKYILISDKQEITAIIGEGDIPNAKPIYCHPIHIENNAAGQNNYHLTFLIFNDDATPFTLTSLDNWLRATAQSLPEGINEVQIMISGGVKSADATPVIIIASYLWYGSSVGFAGVEADGTLRGIYASTLIDLVGGDCTLTDAVNKIN